VFWSLLAAPAWGLILGGTGNQPLHDPGWPENAATAFNTPSRVAYWEGPPFGGGQWHAECRGDAKAFNNFLLDFVRIDVLKKRIVVHDGVGTSFWLNPNAQADKAQDARIDWTFTVWQLERWKMLQNLPADLRSPEITGDAEPLLQVDVYTGGNIHWPDVHVPNEITIVDHRLQSHGYDPQNGSVIEGTILHWDTHQPLPAIVRWESHQPQPDGGYQYTTLAKTTTTPDGHWTLQKPPTGSGRLIAEAPGFVPRVFGYVAISDQPRWHEFHTQLIRPVSVSGRVLDGHGTPLADAQVHLRNVLAHGQEKYESSAGYTFQTNAQGEFVAELIPPGRMTLTAHKKGYSQIGLGQEIDAPASHVELQLLLAGELHVQVELAKLPRQDNYMVRIIPAGGEAVGKWSGSGNVDAKGKIQFSQIPPGTYQVTGRPNPGSDDEETQPVRVEIHGGKTAEIVLSP
jgi:hypothetical protein